MEQNRERTGIVLPYEQAAMNKEPMPEGLEFPDQIMYQGLRYLYAYYKMGWISLPHCIISNGWCLTANTSESHNSEEGCTLSDILMHDVPEKYFLSEAAMRKILSSLSPAHRDKESTKQTV